MAQRTAPVGVWNWKMGEPVAMAARAARASGVPGWTSGLMTRAAARRALPLAVEGI